ncbi:hypothetical protein CHS0354_027067 [Potamilus streckersoni]|uniref:Uncharacterized protein n=1 Tax=Potamilus streckersoni TaxID=2493646 RepID=A0AAE0S7F4_9BIVA|nr:hypothetical protein CHS0354_027067 [Potamilus streckersoni]
MAKYNTNFLFLTIIVISCLSNGYGLDAFNKRILQRRNFVRNFCVARCNMGRGGNVCRCNGFHFAGKRSEQNVFPPSSVEMNSVPGQIMALLDDSSQVQSLKSDTKYKDILHGQTQAKLQDNSQIREEDLQLILSIILREIVEGRSDELLEYVLEHTDGREQG